MTTSREQNLSEIVDTLRAALEELDAAYDIAEYTSDFIKGLIASDCYSVQNALGIIENIKGVEEQSE